MYPDYLVHYNKNHSPKNGQFISGDGDGDNIRDDHHNYKKNKVNIKKEDIPNTSYQGQYKLIKDFNSSEEGKKLIDDFKKVKEIYDEYLSKYYDIKDYDNITFYNDDPKWMAQFDKAEKDFWNAGDNYIYSRGKYVMNELLKNSGGFYLDRGGAGEEWVTSISKDTLQKYYESNVLDLDYL